MVVFLIAIAVILAVMLVVVFGMTLDHIKAVTGIKRWKAEHDHLLEESTDEKQEVDS